MTHALRALRRMRRDETEAEFAAFPVPKTWAGFAPVAVPHMSAARGADPHGRSEAEAARAEKNTRDAFTTAVPERLSTKDFSAAETAPRPRFRRDATDASGARVALLVAAVAAASFSVGRFWSTRHAS